MRRLAAPLALLAWFGLATSAQAVRWDPLDVAEIDSLDAVAVSQRMAKDPDFHKLMVDRFFFSGPAVRGDFLTRWKGGAISADANEDRARMTKQYEEFRLLPVVNFHFFKMKGVNQGELDQFCRTYAINIHSNQTSAFLGLIGKTNHMLISGPDAGIDAMKEKFKYKIEYQDPVQEFRLQVQYKVGAGWAELVIPTGERYSRDFNMVDAWTAAGIFAKLADGPEGVRSLIERGVITLHQGQGDVGKISNVAVKAFLPFVTEPFYSH